MTIQALTDLVEDRSERTVKEVDQVVHLLVSEYFECLPPPTPTPTPTATATPPPSDGFIDVEVLHFVGARYPLEQLHLAEADACLAKHYHAGVRVFSLEGGDLLDPNPLVCGFGRENKVEITVERIEMTVWEDYRNRLIAATD